MIISSSTSFPIMVKPLSLYNSSDYAYNNSSFPQIFHHHHHHHHHRAFTKTSRNSNDIPNRCYFNNYFCNFRDPRKTQKFNNVSTVHYQARESGSWERETPQRNLKDGIGISRFLQGKNFLITGATGFVAKVLIEKILRTSPDVGQIFLLVKAKDKEAALNRLKTEIIDSGVMKKVKEVHGEKYEEFMMKKLVAIPGNICESDLGIDPLNANHIANNVHVIVNSAATTNFDERYDVALSVNTKGPSHLLSFAKTCKKVCLFLHISTAYVNDGRVGKIEETALIPMLDIENEMKLVSSLMEHSVQENQHSNQNMKQLGLQRAKIHGWKNCYTFTKAMGEMKISSTIGDIPIVILRPSVIESTYKEPFSGWIEENRMLDPFLTLFGKGQLLGLFVDPQVIADVVPVDMVVNAAIAAMAKHGISGIPNINVYQIGSSMVNPVTIGNIVDYTNEYFKSNPLLDSKGDEISISKTKYFSSIGDFSHYITTEITRESGLMEALINNVKTSLYTKLDRQCKKRVQFFIQMAKTYETFGFFRGRFEIGNAQKLREEMSMEERKKFEFEVEDINWKEYFCRIHIPGLRKHVLKE